MAGIDEFKKKMKGYRNPKIVGITIAKLISVRPVTFCVGYGDVELKFTAFRSLTDMSGLKKEDIGRQYTVMFTSDNQGIYILGEIYTYKDLYIEE